MSIEQWEMDNEYRERIALGGFKEPFEIFESGWDAGAESRDGFYEMKLENALDLCVAEARQLSVRNRDKGHTLLAECYTKVADELERGIKEGKYYE